METKICKKCGIEKPIENFRQKKNQLGKYYLYSYCKQCETIYTREYIKQHYKERYKQIRKASDKRYRENHKEEIKNKSLIRYKNMTPEQKEKRKTYMGEYTHQWRQNNKEKIKDYIKTDREKRKNNTFLRFKDQIRHELLRSFKAKGYNKNYHTKTIVGIELKELYEYLKNTFKTNYGYEWNEIEPVHIDHIIPLSTAHNEEEIIKLCHYTNLQLLKPKDNLKKYNKVN